VAGNGKRKKRNRPQFTVNQGKVAKTNGEGRGKAERKDQKRGKAGAELIPIQLQFREYRGKWSEEQKAKHLKDGLCFVWS
jgi:hypothetical protein